MEGMDFGPYRVVAELGSGGMGRVYRAEVLEAVGGLTAGTAVALKVIHPHLLEKGGAFKRFLREGRIGQRIDHENVVRTHDCDALLVNGQQVHFLVMEYVDGQTLRGLLEELERVPEALCRHIAREVAKGLTAIHAVGAVHRDLKPENILITRDHRVKLMDLGIARSLDELVHISQTGDFVGSLPYAAPEQFRLAGGGPDGRADLHALGTVLHELATGVHPFRDVDASATLHRILEAVPAKLGELDPQLSAFLEEVVHCLLAKDPRDRFASAAVLLTVLEEGEEGSWWTARSRALQSEDSRPVRRMRLPRETAVYGRDAEIAAAHRAFERARAGNGSVLLIEGEAGIGKSRVADEAVARLQQQGEDVTFLVGSYPPGGAATAEAGFSGAFREQLGEAGSGPWLPQNQILVPAFDAMLRGEGPPPDTSPLDKGAIQSCFARTAWALARERPTVILVEDLHFAPEEGRALFTSLALATRGHRILLIGTMRPGMPEAWASELTRLEHVARLEVPRLGPDDLAVLLRDAFGSAQLAADLGAEIARKSDGNPFFVFEILRGLREGQFIAQSEDGTWAASRAIERIDIPSSVRDLVAARVAALDDEQRELLDVAACLGHRFDAGLVGDVLGLARLPALRQFGRIERRHRLVRSVGRLHQFDHHQVKEALYGSLNEQLREELHGALAEALEARVGDAPVDGPAAVALADHFLKGGRGERALRYLQDAHAHLTASYLHRAAADLLAGALAVPGLVSGAARIGLLLRLAASLDPVGDRARQEAAAREAVELAEASGDASARARARLALGQVLQLLTRYADSQAMLESALEAAREAGDHATRADALNKLGIQFFHESKFEEARAYLEQQRTLEREIGNARGEGGATANLSLIHWSQGRLGEAREGFEQYLELGRQINDRAGQAAAHGNLGTIAYLSGDTPAARRHWEQYLSLAREIGHRVHEATATGNLGNAYRAEGRLVEARDHYERHLRIAESIGYGIGKAVALVNIGAVWTAAGEVDIAREALERACQFCREIGAQYPLGYGLLDLARVARAAGDRAAARHFCQESLELRRGIGHGDGVADALLFLAELELEEGRHEASRDALLEALRLAREQERKVGIATALALAARLPGGDREAAEAAVRDCEGDTAMDARFHLWRATDDRIHLDGAKRILDTLLERSPTHRATILSGVPLHRELVAALG